MKREIKFRAWEKTEKKMGVVEVLTDQGCFILGITPGKDTYLNGGKTIVVAPTDGRFVPFQECELMQFTGLKDLNGKEIYEGDIITSKLYPFQDNYCHDIYFDEAEFRVRWTMFRLSEVFEHPNHNVEVIGNIYENPELLNT